MSRAEPLITAEELQCLLGDGAERHGLHGIRFATARQHPEILQKLQLGAMLCLLKGALLYAVLMSPEALNLASASRYLWMRGGLELVCLLVFAVTCRNPKNITMTHACLLVAGTTWVMDVMSLLAVPG